MVGMHEARTRLDELLPPELHDAAVSAASGQETRVGPLLGGSVVIVRDGPTSRDVGPSGPWGQAGLDGRLHVARAL